MTLIMKGNLKTIILMDLDFLCMKMEIGMKETGLRIKCMEEAVFCGGMGRNILGSSIMIGNMEEVFLSGRMAGCMMEIGNMIMRMGREGLRR